MAKILCIGDSPSLDTGFGRVLRAVNQAFVDAGHNVQMIGWYHQHGRMNFPYPIYPADKSNNQVLASAFNTLVQQWRPDIVFTLEDVPVLSWIPTVPLRKTFKWIAYFPLDGGPIPSTWVSIIKNMDRIITYSNYAKKLVNKQVPEKKAEMIYHGVDLSTFKPIHDKSDIRQAYGLRDKFVVGCVARNQMRKNLPALIKSFAEFSKDKDDVALYMHTVPYEVFGWNLNEIIEMHGLAGKVYMTSGISPGIGVSDKTLATIYNLFDIKVLPTNGEGFGLPILEAHACGIPVLVTNYSACSELTVGPQERIKVNAYFTNNMGYEHAIVDNKDMVKKMNYFYNNREAINEYGLKGIEMANKLIWADLTEKFVDVIREESKSANSIQSKLPRFHRI